jgi:PAS domain S-box-containing protein
MMMQPPDLLLASLLDLVVDSAPLCVAPDTLVNQAIAQMNQPPHEGKELASSSSFFRCSPQYGSENGVQISPHGMDNVQSKGVPQESPENSSFKPSFEHSLSNSFKSSLENGSTSLPVSRQSGQGSDIGKAPHFRSCVLVVEANQLVGIFTERDVVRLVAAGVDLSTVTLSAVMTQPVIALTYVPCQRLSAAYSLMHQHQIRHLPMLDGQGHLMGLMTQASLLQAYDCLQVERSQDLMGRNVSPTELQELNLALQNAIEGISHLDRDGKYLSVNHTYAEVCSYQPDEMIGMNWQKTVHPDDRVAMIAAYQQMLNTGRVETETRGIRKDGSTFYKQLTMVATYNDQGDFTGHYSFLKDISDRKLAEIALQQQLEQEQLVTAIAQRIRRSLDLDEILNITVEEVRQLLQPERVIILQFAPDWKGTVVAESVHAAWPSILSTTIYDPCFCESYTTTYRQGRVTSNSDIYTAGLSQCHIDLLKHFQIRANLVVPILQGENLWGLLIAQQCASAREWQPFEIELLKQLSLQLGIAIQQADLYRQIQVELMERQRVEEALRVSETLYRDLVELQTDLIIRINLQGRLTFANSAATQIFGVQPNKVRGKSILQFVHPDDLPNVTANLQAVTSLPYQLITREQRAFTVNGLRWFQWNVAAIKDHRGQVVEIQGVGRDITDRKQVEEALRQSEQRFRRLVESNLFGVVFANFDGAVHYANDAFLTMVGYSQEDLQAGHIRWDQLTPVEFAALDERVIEELKSRGVSTPHEKEYIRKDGSRVPILLGSALLKEPYDQQQEAVAFCLDLTEKKQLERQFLRAQRLESIGNLSSGIAHDLNNILTPMLTVAQLLPTKFPQADERTQQLLKILETNAKRGAELVKQVVLFVRGVEGKHMPLQMRHLLAEIEQILQQTFPKAIALSVDIPSSLWQISGDITQLHQVLMNLCINACDAMPEGGLLNLKAQNLWVNPKDIQLEPDAQLGAYVMVAISDTGIGIPPDIIDKIFEPFFTTKAHGKGTGLGLSTVVGILKSHRGFVNVSSRVGEGTEFRVFLPALGTTTMPLETALEQPFGKGELILVVDDEIAIRETTREFLESHHYQVITAGSGSEAIALYHQHQDKLQLVITDMMMPSMSGQSMIQSLRVLNSHLKIIAFSGLVANEKIAIAAGVNAFLAKPFSSQELLSQVHHVLTQSGSSRSNSDC